MAEDKKCESKTCNCGSPNCPTCCASGCARKCPFTKVERIVCLVLKLVKIFAFFAAGLVLFDLHGIFGHVEHNMNAQAAMIAQAQAQQATQQSGAPQA